MGIAIAIGVASVSMAYACIHQPDKQVVFRRFAAAFAATGLFAMVAGVAMIF